MRERINIGRYRFVRAKEGVLGVRHNYGKSIRKFMHFLLACDLIPASTYK